VSEDQSDRDESGNRYSETKNVAGVDLEKARSKGIVGLIITVPLTLYLAIFGVLGPNFGLILLAWFPLVGMGLSYMYAVSEKRWQNSWIMSPGDMDANNERSTSEKDTKSVCRECHTEISSGAKRCPSCGWKPKKRGGLWWGTTALMSFNPIGWVMGAKGASDNIKATRGVSKEVSSRGPDSKEEESDVPTESDPTEKLERLNELQNQGAITEAEYEEKKEDLLDRI
jgi:hypothetical protein